MKKKIFKPKYNIEDNIFLSLNKAKTGYKFHPFLDYTGAHSGMYNFENDYFGYRNLFDYEVEKYENEFKIFMTGGSECAGHTHNQPITFLLEKNLRKHYSSKKIRVLNFCMNSYTLPYEIQSFVHLGWYLKPDLVIAHTGWNDAFAFPLMPKKFGELGLNYSIFQEEWMDIIHSQDTSTVFETKVWDRHIRNHDQKMFISSIEKTLKKYKALVNSSGSDFLVGIQPWNIYPTSEAVLPGKHRDMLYANVEMLKNQSESFDMDVLNFATNNEKYRFHDTVHTTQESAKLIANKYFLFIKENYNDKIVKIINNGN